MYQVPRGFTRNGSLPPEHDCSARLGGNPNNQRPNPVIWDLLLFSKEKQSCGADDSDDEEHDVVCNEIRIGHEGEAEKHRLPDVHPFPVNERDEPDRSEKQSAEEVGTVKNRHALFLSYFWARESNTNAWSALCANRGASDLVHACQGQK